MTSETRRGPTLDDVSLPVEFLPQRAPAPLRVWRTRSGYLVRLEVVAGPPRACVYPSSERHARSFYARVLAEAGHELVWLSLGRAGGSPAALMIAEAPLAHRGTFYLGSLTVPFRDSSFRFSVSSPAPARVPGVPDDDTRAALAQLQGVLRRLEQGIRLSSEARLVAPFQPTRQWPRLQRAFGRAWWRDAATGGG